MSRSGARQTRASGGDSPRFGDLPQQLNRYASARGYSDLPHRGWYYRPRLPACPCRRVDRYASDRERGNTRDYRHGRIVGIGLGYQANIPNDTKELICSAQSKTFSDVPSDLSQWRSRCFLCRSRRMQPIHSTLRRLLMRSVAPRHQSWPSALRFSASSPSFLRFG